MRADSVPFITRRRVHPGNPPSGKDIGFRAGPRIEPHVPAGAPIRAPKCAPGAAARGWRGPRSSRDRSPVKVLVTGVAGFIGSFTARRLIERGDEVVGIDNLNDYYDVRLKRARLARLRESSAFVFDRVDISNAEAILAVFSTFRPDRVVHLAAQAGVRHSLVDPHAYVEANLKGFAHVLEAAREAEIEHLVYASTSSVYGANTNSPFSEHHGASHPLSLYAATKRSNELMAHAYSHLFGIPTTGLRYFTVYGPWGRPDQALFTFTRKILAGEPIDVYNNGDHRRDFTYVDDAVDATVRALDRVASPHGRWDGTAPDPATSAAPYRLYNVGGNSPVELLRYIELIERFLGRAATKRMLPMQPGDVPETWAESSDRVRDLGLAPQTPLETGVERFITWYRDYYEIGE